MAAEAKSILAAAREGDVEGCKAALRQNPDDAVGHDENGMTALHWACRRDCVPIVKELLALSTVVASGTDNWGFTPLMWAVSKGGFDSAMVLLASGRDLNLAAVDQDSGFSVLHWAVNKSAVQAINRLVALGADPNLLCKRGLPPLLWACIAGDYLTARALLDNAADPAFADDRGTTALHLAAAREPEIVRLLVQLRVDVSAPTRDFSSTPLHEAAASGQVDCAAILIGAGAKVGSASKEGNTPLHHAAHHGHTAVVRLLLEAAAPVDAKNSDSVTPLHLAVFHSRAEIVALIIAKAPSAIDVATARRTTALHIAASEGHADLCSALVAAGAGHALLNAAGLTAMHCAVARAQVPAVRALVKAGASPLALSASGESVIDAAARGGDAKLARYLSEKARAPAAAAAATAAAGSAPAAAAAGPADGEGPPPPGRTASRPGGGEFGVDASPIAVVAGAVAWEIAYSSLSFRSTIGKGSYGEVYVGEWRGTTVAIKQFSVRAMNERNRALFQGEVDVMASLRHPNVVLFMGACTDMQNPLCIVTEYVAGGSLFHGLCDKNRAMTWVHKLRVAHDIACGMNYLHCANPVIMHRDLKSLNVLVDENWGAKVCDFGLTKVKQTAWVQTRCGTPHYMSPQVLLRENYDEKADVFAFGIILWEVLTRQQPYAKMAAMEVARRVVQTGMRPPVPPKAPAAYEELMVRAWHQAPEERPTFGDAIKVLSAMLAEAVALEKAK